MRRDIFHSVISIVASTSFTPALKEFLTAKIGDSSVHRNRYILQRRTPSSFKIYILQLINLETSPIGKTANLLWILRGEEEISPVTPFPPSKEENRRDSVDRDGTSRDVHSLLRDILSRIKGQLVRDWIDRVNPHNYKFASNIFLSI